MVTVHHHHYHHHHRCRCHQHDTLPGRRCGPNWHPCQPDSKGKEKKARQEGTIARRHKINVAINNNKGKKKKKKKKRRLCWLLKCEWKLLLMLPPRLRSRTPHANGSFPFPHQPDSPPRCWLKRKRSSISTPHHHHHHQHHRPSATTNTQPSPTQPVLSHPPHNPTFTHTHASPLATKVAQTSIPGPLYLPPFPSKSHQTKLLDTCITQMLHPC